MFFLFIALLQVSRRRPPPSTTDADDAEGLATRYPKVSVRDFDGNPNAITEMDALVAYLQMLGTLIDFDAYKADGANAR